MHVLQTIIRQNNEQAAKVRGHVSAVTFNARLKELREARVERNLKRQRKGDN